MLFMNGFVRMNGRELLPETIPQLSAAPSGLMGTETYWSG